MTHHLALQEFFVPLQTITLEECASIGILSEYHLIFFLIVFVKRPEGPPWI